MLMIQLIMQMMWKRKCIGFYRMGKQNAHVALSGETVARAGASSETAGPS